MNPAHVHLLTNHLPILGSLFGLLVLVYSFLLRNPQQQVRTAAYLILLVAALGAAVTNWSGEGAEELVEHLPGVSHDAIEVHEDAAVYALWGALLTGLLALAGMAVSIARPALNGRMALVIALFALLSSTISARTGWLGGKIRHTELDGPPAAASGPGAGGEGRGD